VSALARYQSSVLEALFGAQEPHGRLAIYRRNVLGTLRDALASAYPVVRRLVGEAFFDEAARRYALATPSRSGNLHGHGQRFADFLQAYPHAAPLPWLADVARLEWAVHECFHAEETPAFDARRLAMADAFDYERLTLHLAPSARLLSSAHPVLAIREANLGDGDGSVGSAAGPDFLLVRRDGLDVAVDRLEPCEWRFLEALARGMPVGAACDAFGEDAEHRLGPALARHARAGLFCACEPAV
jgi:hypothetical protein